MTKYSPTRPIDLCGPNPQLDEKEEEHPQEEEHQPEETLDIDNDQEIKSLELVLQAMAPLSTEARRRVIQWASDRFL